jgi:hypothetical protein
MKKILYVFIFVAFAITSAEAQRVEIKFTPESDKFTGATVDYQALWQSDGDKIIRAMEKVSGLKFKETEIETIVFEGVSRSGYPGESPMKMRASYKPDTKKATLVHELGHRHISQLKIRPEGLDEHSVLFLTLYDIWVELYGKKFADEQVEIEKARRGPYPAAWDYALKMTKKEREDKFREIIRQNQKRSLSLTPRGGIFDITVQFARRSDLDVSALSSSF